MELMQMSQEEVFKLTCQALARELQQVHEVLDVVHGPLERQLHQLDHEFEEILHDTESHVPHWQKANAKAQQTRARLNDLAHQLN